MSRAPGRLPWVDADQIPVPREATMLDTLWWWTARSTTSTCCPAVSSTPRPCPSLVSAHLPARLHRSPGTHGCEWKRPGRHRTWGSIHRLDAAGRRAGPRRSRFQPHRDPLQRPLIWGPRLGAALGAQDPLLPTPGMEGRMEGAGGSPSAQTPRVCVPRGEAALPSEGPKAGQLLPWGSAGGFGETSPSSLTQQKPHCPTP